MANKTFARGGDGTTLDRLVDLGSNQYALAASLETLLAGEDQTNNRLRTMALPVAGDVVSTTIQNAVATAVNGNTDAVGGYKKLAFVLTITATITVTFQASFDGGSTFIGIACHDVTQTADATKVASATATGVFAVPERLCGTITHLRAPTSAPSGSPSATVVTLKCP